MSERMITVTSGEGSDFKKEEMSESEFNAKYRKGLDVGRVQTDYDENAEVSDDEPKTEEAETSTRRGRK